MNEPSLDIIETRRGQIGRWTGLGLAIGVLIFVVAVLAGTDDITPYFSAIGLAAALGAVIGVIRYWLTKRTT